MLEWFTLRVYDHTPAREQLMLALLEAFEGLQQEGWVQRFFLQRHWMHGPHVKVHFQTSEVLSALRARVQPEIQQFFVLPREKDTLTDAEYLERYSEVARWEVADEDLLPLYGSKTTFWEPSTFRDHRFGNAFVSGLVKQVLSEVQPTLKWLLTVPASGKIPRAYQLMAGFAFTLGRKPEVSGMPEVATCFASHAEAFYHNLPNGEDLRKQFVLRSQHHQNLLFELTHQVETRPALEVRLWMDVLSGAYDRAMQAEKLGEFQISTADTYLQEYTRMPEGMSPKEFTSSPVHRAFQDPTHPIHQYIQRPEFKARRLFVNVLYELLHSAGIRASERLLLCQFADSTLQNWRSFEEVAQ